MLTTDIEISGLRTVKWSELMIEMRAQSEKFGAKDFRSICLCCGFFTTTFQALDALACEHEPRNSGKGTPEDFTKLREALKVEPHDVESGSDHRRGWCEVKNAWCSGENEHIGRGVSTCAVCDAAFTVANGRWLLVAATQRWKILWR
jgi:hypothetical protein